MTTTMTIITAASGIATIGVFLWGLIVFIDKKIIHIWAHIGKLEDNYNSVNLSHEQELSDIRISLSNVGTKVWTQEKLEAIVEKAVEAGITKFENKLLRRGIGQDRRDDGRSID